MSVILFLAAFEIWRGRRAARAAACGANRHTMGIPTMLQSNSLNAEPITNRNRRLSTLAAS